MKKFYVAAFLLSAFACKKDASIVTDSKQESHTVPVLSKNFDINNASKAEVMSILSYLDNASPAEKKHLYERLFGPAPLPEQMVARTVNSTANANMNEYTPEQILASMQPVQNGNFWDADGVAETMRGGHWGLVLFYKWTILYSPIFPFIVQSTEKVELADEVNHSNVESRYAIQTLSHSGSAIVGIAPFASWAEIGNILYHGIYTAHSSVDGVLSGMSMHRSVQASRIFNAGAVIHSGGQRAKL
ncbi:hypothetical protein [Chitinophaga rhizophila]|uniref:Uncharacterized protein n=1 Tax=Chitinophaga rhizophila TaxID=2866212 RepID=A0ABS7G8C2_9BACT|nr:hypothetical protein [Chitinophaga rhizophila]MBW8683375.1 hypothetical protein [Chitinophaga rhizophila]